MQPLAVRALRVAFSEGPSGLLRKSQNYLRWLEAQHAGQGASLALRAARVLVTNGPRGLWRKVDEQVRLRTRRGPVAGAATFSVVSAVYNKADSLEAFLRAYFMQTYAGPIELVLVDDASTDGSAALIKRLAAKAPPNVRVRLIEHAENLGNCASRNEGVAASTGAIVAIMDADNIVNRRFVDEHFAAHEGGAQAVVGPLNIESQDRPIDQVMDDYEADPARVLVDMRLQDPDDRDSFLNCITRNFSIERDAIEQPLFDEAFTYRVHASAGFGWEDVDMGYRLHQRGLTVRFTSKAWAVHKSHPPAVPENEKAVRSVRNFRKLHEKHPDLQVVARKWSLGTFSAIDNWLRASGNGSNPDARALRTLLDVDGSRGATGPRARLPGGVLFVSGVGGDTRRYRCEHTLEYLRIAGRWGRQLPVDDPELLGARLERTVEQFDVFVLHRVAMSPTVSALIDCIKAKGRTVVFETDDLIFEPAYPSFLARIGLASSIGAGDVQRYQATLARCDGALCSTTFLKQRLEAAGKRAWVVRNGVTDEMRSIADGVVTGSVGRGRNLRVVIGYASGTPSHQRDFEVAAPALLEVLERYGNSELRVIGHLALDARFQRFEDRVVSLPPVSWRALPRVLRGFDVNIAPLEADHDFCRAKSEIKFTEAALVRRPTIASPVAAYLEAIRDGETGLVARTPADWAICLERLVSNAMLRHTLADAAYRDVTTRYAPDRLAAQLAVTLTEVEQHAHAMTARGAA